MKLPLWVVLLGVIVTMLIMTAFAKDAYEEKRQQMLAVIQQTVAMTKSYIGTAFLDKRVEAAAMGKFVLPDSRSYAYENTALPIRHNQTISQPYIINSALNRIESVY